MCIRDRHRAAPWNSCQSPPSVLCPALRNVMQKSGFASRSLRIPFAKAGRRAARCCGFFKRFFWRRFKFRYAPVPPSRQGLGQAALLNCGGVSLLHRKFKNFLKKPLDRLQQSEIIIGSNKRLNPPDDREEPCTARVFRRRGRCV